MSESVKREVDVDFEYRAWLNTLKRDKTIYDGGDQRVENIGMLFGRFVERGVDYETALSYKRQVMNDLIHDEGKKYTNKKNHRTHDGRSYYKWQEQIGEDFDDIITEYYNPNDGISVERVVFQHSKFKLPENPAIIAWVKDRYGDSQDLIEQAHNINNKLCHEYFSELEMKTKEVSNG